MNVSQAPHRRAMALVLAKASGTIDVMTMPDTPEKLQAQGAMLRNRLQKRSRHLERWAKRIGTDAYRLYDRDIPEIPLAIDRYGDCLYLAAFRRGDSVDDAAEQGWLEAMQRIAAEAIGVSLENTALKRRERQRGTAQYERDGQSGRRVLVNEGGHRFYVNLWDYLDTGLFLDHRTTRAMVAAECGGKRVLNLYAYTGSFGVYAQGAGATEVVQVDLSRTYLDWARDNVRLNRLDERRHTFVQEDCLRYLSRVADEGGRFDVVVCDPPTFSNSKRMDGTLDVKRDHIDLLTSIRRVLGDEGVCWFSTNARGFVLAEAVGAHFELVADMTERTRAEDFEGRHSHRAWRLAHPRG
ncbi:MAG: class I SAM-dependent methyltransferase [Myxococcota bacterium]